MDPALSLHRGFSDSMAFAPQQASQLSGGRKPSLHLRGTVSMPTSPLLGHRSLAWADQPHSAQGFFDVHQHVEPPSATHWFPSFPENNYAPSSSGSLSVSFEELDESVPPPTDTEMHDHSGMNGSRKKRAQVRIACTHCQKACKKCSNTRPCERCVKYGLKDCVDSTRKPRKTGIKRGPYKRRSSNKYHASGYFSNPSAHPLPPSANSYSHNQGYTDHPYPQYPAPASLLQQGVSQSLAVQHESGPPGPRTSALHGAFASALSGPRWVNGQRLSISCPQDGQLSAGATNGDALYPPTPTVPFPLSLSYREDPFSRAVSPIHGDLDQALAGLKPTVTEALSLSNNLGFFSAANPFQGLGRQADVSMSPTQPKLPAMFTDPFAAASSYRQDSVNAQIVHALSAPTSPRQQPWASAQFRSSSAEPGNPLPSPFASTHPLASSTVPGALQSPAMIALKKIRKPSLRTLMSRGGSQAGSRQVSPIPESPTLFNQPMAIDEGGLEADMSGNAGIVKNGDWDMRDLSQMNAEAESDAVFGLGFDSAMPFHA